jgi:ribosomal protein S1
MKYIYIFLVVDRVAGARVNPTTVSLGDIDEQDEVSGTVVRVSNYGVFIDIGAGVDAFLHRRKMKLNKKKMVLKPWEIAPLGSTVKVYICIYTCVYISIYIYDIYIHT